MIVLLILIPALAGAAAFFIASDSLRRGLLVSIAIVQFALSVANLDNAACARAWRLAC